MNVVTLTGRLAQDPIINKVGETSVCKFTICVDNKRKVNNEWINKPDFIDCENWDTGAVTLSTYAKKGTKLGVTGALRMDRWTDETGKNFSKMKVRVSNFELLSPKPQTQSQGQPQENNPAVEEDIPF